MEHGIKPVCAPFIHYGIEANNLYRKVVVFYSLQRAVQ